MVFILFFFSSPKASFFVEHFEFVIHARSSKFSRGGASRVGIAARMGGDVESGAGAASGSSHVGAVLAALGMVKSTLFRPSNGRSSSLMLGLFALR